MIPHSLYAYGVTYALRDSVTGFWLKSEITEKRMLLCLVRNSVACRCGCKGWCAMHTIFAILAWSMRCIAAGQYPTRRYDGSEFGAAEPHRQALARQAMDVAGLAST